MSDFETQAIDYWKAQAERADAHAQSMYRSMEYVKQKILQAEPTNRMLECLGVIGESLAKHERYFVNKSNKTNQ